MDEQRLDGNAAGGILEEVFAFEITTARAARAAVDAGDQVGGRMAHVSEIGTVVRCAACRGVLIRVARQDQGRGRHLLDLRGVEYLQLDER